MKMPSTNTPVTSATLRGALAALCLIVPTVAEATTCAPREVVIDRLTKKFGETRQSIGLGPNNQMIEVFASDSTGTWTITATRASGLACLLASGQAFETLAEALPSDDADA